MAKVVPGIGAERPEDIEPASPLPPVPKNPKPPVPRNPKSPVSPSPPSLTSSPDFKIENLADRYRVHNVQYNNGVYVVDWSKELLEQGAVMRQQEWIEATRSSEWKVPNMQLYHATLRTLYQHREHPVKKQNKMVEVLRKMFKADFDISNPYMMTSTRIRYAARGKNIVTHDVGSVTAIELNVSIGRLNAWIKRSSVLEEKIDALLGSRDLAEIETIYEWINDQKPSLDRFNPEPAREPAHEKELAVALSYDGCMFVYVNFCGYNGPSRGVVASAQKK